MKITLGSILSYVVGVPLTLLGLLLTIQSPVGLLPFVAGILLLPVVRRMIASKAGIEFSRGAAAGIGTFGVISGLVLLLALAGGSSGGGVGSDVSNVSVTAEDATPADAGVSLEITWNSRAQSAVNPDPDDLTKYNADEGQKFLIVRMKLSNTGEEPLELTPRFFRVESNGVEYEYQSLFGTSNNFVGVTVNPEGSYVGWIAFTLPEDTPEASLKVKQDAYRDKNVSVSFAHDPEMPINVSD